MISPDQALSVVQEGLKLVDAPWGPRLVNAVGRVRASSPRLNVDWAKLGPFLSEIIPMIKQDLPRYVAVFKKHSPGAIDATNDVIPIIEAVVNDLQA